MPPSPNDASRWPRHARPEAMALGRPFSALAGANLAAQAAEQVSLVAVPIVAVMALNAGPTQIGLLNAAQTLPFLLLALPLGLWADRHSRRGLMLVAEAVRALALAGLWWVTVADQPGLALLAALGFVGACGTVGFSVAAPALVPALVPASALGLANGRLELARSLAFAAGPALAGTLVSWAGAPSAFVLATLLSCAALVMLWRLPEPARQPAAARHPWLELTDGARLVWQHPLLRPVLLTSVVWNISWFVLHAAYVPHAMRVLGLDASGVGLTLAAYGVGMVLGALAAPRIMAGQRFGNVVALGPLTSVVAAGTLAASLAWPHPWLAAVSMFLFGAGPILWTISSTTLRQTLTPSAMLGRMSAIFLALNAGARPLGAALGAAIGATAALLGADARAEAACLLLALAGFGLQAMMIWRSPVRTLQQLPVVA